MRSCVAPRRVEGRGGEGAREAGRTLGVSRAEPPQSRLASAASPSSSPSAGVFPRGNHDRPVGLPSSPSDKTDFRALVTVYGEVERFVRGLKKRNARYMASRGR